MHEKIAAVMGRTPTATLITSLHTLDAIESPNEEERMVRAWTIEELENRFPAASAAVEAAFDAAELRAMEAADFGHPVEDIGYVAVLLANIPAVTA